MYHVIARDALQITQHMARYIIPFKMQNVSVHLYMRITSR